MSVIKTFMKINNLQSQPWHSLADILAMPGPRILTRAFQLLFLDALLRLGAHVGMNTQMFALLGWRLSLLSGQVRNMKNNTGDPTKIIWLKHIVQEHYPTLNQLFLTRRWAEWTMALWMCKRLTRLGLIKGLWCRCGLLLLLHLFTFCIWLILQLWLIIHIVLGIIQQRFLTLHPHYQIISYVVSTLELAMVVKTWNTKNCYSTQ